LAPEKKPLIAGALESGDEFGQRFRLGIRELAGLRLAEPGGLKRAPQRLEWIYVRDKGEVAEPRADQLRELRQQSGADHR
jgi:hypothetical protein